MPIQHEPHVPLFLVKVFPRVNTRALSVSALFSNQIVTVIVCSNLVSDTADRERNRKWVHLTSLPKVTVWKRQYLLISVSFFHFWTSQFLVTVWLAFPKSGLKALLISNFHESKEFKKQVQPEIIESWPSLAGYVLIPIWHKSNNESRLNARTSK